MWHDIEAEVDLLNFGLVADAAANLIRDAGDTPVTIGVSGGWGAGKSTLVKLVRAHLEDSNKKEKHMPNLFALQGPGTVASPTRSFACIKLFKLNTPQPISWRSKAEHATSRSSCVESMVG